MLAKALDRTYNEDLNTFDLWWMENSDKQQAIARIGIGVHYNGTISMMVVPHYFTSEHVLIELGKNNGAKHVHRGAAIDLDSFVESRTLVCMMHDFDDEAGLNETIASIDAISPLSQNVFDLVNALKQQKHRLPVNDIHDDVIQIKQLRTEFIEQGQAFSEQMRQDLAKLHKSLNDVARGQSIIDDWLPHFDYPTIPEAILTVGGTHPFGTQKYQQRYNPDIHDQMPDGRTQLTRALLDRSLTDVKAALIENPYSVVTADAYNDKPFTLVIKSTADLISAPDPEIDERLQIHSIYQYFFNKNNLTMLSQEEFFEDNIPSDREKNVFVELCYVDGKIVSFISFKLIDTHHKSIGDFQVYYGKLGATNA